MFYTDSFEIYRTASGFVGDNRGLFDYVPPGCGLQANIVDLWRKYFVLEEDMLELVRFDRLHGHPGRADSIRS